MKIVVHNAAARFALSRRQMEAIRAALPEEYFAPVRVLHLTAASPYDGEPFEFFPKEQVAYFAFPLKQEGGEEMAEAIEELLIGLARLKEGSRFGVPLSQKERDGYRAFIDQWREECLRAAGAS